MASSKIKGITIEIGGDTTKLGTALDKSEKQSRSLQNELKAVNRLLKFDPGNTELLAQKQQLLNGILAETKNKLETLENAQAQVNEQFEKGEIGEDQYRAFQREIISTKSYLESLNSQIQASSNEFEGLESDTKSATSSLDKLKNTINEQETELSQLRDEYSNVVLEQGKSSDEAQELASKMSKLNDDLKENKNKLNEAEKEAKEFSDALDDAGNSADDSSGGFTIMKGALADLVSNAIQGALSAIGDLVGALLELSEATEEYRQMQGKLEGSANTFGYSVDYAKGRYEEFYKYLGDDQMATNAITNLMGLGTSTENVSALAEGAIGVWTAYGDSIPIEGLTEALNETAQVGKVTGSLADALNWAGISEDDFNAKLEKCSSTQERADLIAKTLNDTYGESKKTYDELNGSISEANEAELKLKDTQAQLGEAVEPVNTAMTELKNKALEAIAPLIEKVADAFSKLLEWLLEHPTALKVITALIITLGTAFTILAGALAIQGLINGVAMAISFLNMTLLANPIVLIVALIAGLVAGFIYLWNSCDGFREFWVNLWDGIKSVASTVKDALVEFFTVTIPNAWDKFKEKSSEVISSVVTFFSELPGKLWNAIVGAVERVTQWGANMKAKATAVATNVVNSVVNFFKQLPNKIGYAIGYAIGTLIKWGANMLSWIKTNVPKMITSVVNFFKELPGKIWNAIVGAVNRVATWVSNMKEKATSGAKTLVSNVVNFMKELPSKIASAISSAVTRVATWGSNMKTKAVSAIKTLVSNVTSTAQSLPGKIASAISGAISRLSSWGSQMVSRAKSAMSNVVTTVVSTLKSIPSKVGSIGKNIVEGVWKGISNATSWIKNKVKGFAKSVLGGIKDALGIKSPSRVFRDEVGRYIAEGIGVGITENADDPITALQNVGDEMLTGVKGINGATLNRQLETTFNASVSAGSIADLVALVSDYMPKLIEASKHSIVLDSGALVGETIGQIDAGLGDLMTYRGRGM